MIIDSHAHLTHFKFENEFPFLSVNDNGECVCMEGNRNELFDLMKKQGIAAEIEPVISFFSNEKTLELQKSIPIISLQLSAGIIKTAMRSTA